MNDNVEMCSQYFPFYDTDTGEQEQEIAQTQILAGTGFHSSWVYNTVNISCFVKYDLKHVTT